MFEVNKNKIPIKSWCLCPESGALDQASNLANHPKVFRHIALMPDCHSGYGMPIGGVAAFEDAISPNCVGVDIACGMMAARIGLNKADLSADDLKRIIVQVRRDVPMGKAHQKTDKYKERAKQLVSRYVERCGSDPMDPEITEQAAYSQLGTLGGGK